MLYVIAKALHFSVNPGGSPREITQRMRNVWWEGPLTLLITLSLAVLHRLGSSIGKSPLKWVPYLQEEWKNFGMAEACWQLNIRGDTNFIILVVISSKYIITNREWISHLQISTVSEKWKQWEVAISVNFIYVLRN